ncbi:MAG: serine hydrolase domain-containing protein [Rhodomicrobium sp.]
MAAREFGMIAALLLFFGAGHAAAEEVAPQPLPVTAEELSKVFDPLMAEWIEMHKGAGATITITARDRTVFAKGYGLADVETGKPFTADAALVRPGSISKLFTGIAVMQLVDQGKLDLDRDVNEYLDFKIPTPEGGVPVTLRRLLRHRAGFEEHVKDLFSRARDPEPLRTLLPRSLPQRIFPRGDVAAYSNYGVTLAGYIVERVSGEPYADYVAHHILEPLGMSHSTFKQPLPEALAPMMAKGYLNSKKPIGFFVTIASVPAGGLSATGEDMARFMRALLNGGSLEGARILSQERLTEMTAPGEDATPAGYIGLVFVGGSQHGHKTLGHNGGTMAFLSGLDLFPDEGFGVFVSFDGMGAMQHMPHIASVFAERFLPKTAATGKPEGAAVPDAGRIAGVYHSSRRGETTFVKIADLLGQIRVAADEKGNIRLSSAFWPFGKGVTFTRVDTNTYASETLGGGRLFFDDTDASNPKIRTPAMEFHRVPLLEDARWAVPALAASVLILLLTLLAWPILATWRRWRKVQFSDDSAIRRMYTAIRIAALLDIVAVAAAVVIKLLSSDLTIFSSTLDPVLVIVYALAWLGIPSAIAAAWIAAVFWQRNVGGRWTRVHQTLVAGSMVYLAWFFVTFHLAGTSLNY